MPWLEFQCALISLGFRQFGLSITWVSRIIEWTPPDGFVDVEEAGPFHRWRHQHVFSPEGLLERVDYEVPLTNLGGRWADVLIVRPELERLFAFRHAVTKRALPG
jgi:uncharacterized protein